jgi:hypothetical protein
VGDASLIVGDERLVADQEPYPLAEAWIAAYDNRSEHRNRILGHRQRLSDQHCFDRYAALIESLVPRRLDVVA